MLRFALFFVAGSIAGLSACGGGGDDSSTPTRPAGGGTATQQIAGVRTGVPTAPASPTAAARPDTYTVAAGDTLFAIAERFGTTVEALVAANVLTDPDTLDIGQVLKIPPAN